MKINKALFVPIIFCVFFNAKADDDVQATDQINYSFTGNDTRLGIGITEEGELIADLLKSLHTKYNSNLMMQIWLNDGAGGLEIDYHWVPGLDSENDLTDSSRELKVNKFFVALDQNIWFDKKVTIGAGQEVNDRFWSFNASKSVTGTRLVGQESNFVNQVLTGTLNNRAYIQNRSLENITKTFETPYDWGIGTRFGRFYNDNLVRFSGGLDWEKGDYNSSQVTASLDLEKYFKNSPHSLAFHVEQAQKNGDFEIDKRNTTAFLMYRYSFGKSYKPTPQYEEIKVVDEVALAKLKEEYKEVIQNKIDLSSTAFFNLDSFDLREDTKLELDKLIQQIKAQELASSINIVGHTCYIGTEEYNQKLSENRALATKEYFIANGIDANVLMSSGKGETQPQYDNNSPEFVKNRRVSISFLTLENVKKTEDAPIGEVPVKWVKRPIETPHSWLSRALRNPATHKRTVDVYRHQEFETKEKLGPIVFLNEAPNANADAIEVNRNSTGTLINVLNNDTDPEGDQLMILEVSTPNNGQVENNGNAITYTPNQGFIGTDTFTYTIKDVEGEMDTATVTINVVNQGPKAVDDSVVNESGEKIIIQVLSNDNDPDGENLTIVLLTQPANGSVIINGDGTVSYTSNTGFVGVDSFQYTIKDEDGAESTANVMVTVSEAANKAPQAVDDMYDVQMNSTFGFSPLNNDTDPDGDAISILSVDTSSLVGELTVNSDGTMSYVAPLLFSGNDVFTYTIVDADGATSTATVTLCVAD